MQFSSRAVMLLTLVVCITQSKPISGNADTDTEIQGSTLRPGGDSNRQHSGRHWTTSLNGPYQKIVYSGGDGGGSSPVAEDGDVTEQDRKQRRIHKQSQEIDTSSNSSVVQNATHDSSSTERVLLNTTKLETVRNRNHRNLSSRRGANHHPVDSTTRSTAASNKKRRRLTHFNAATTTPSPSQTMPHSWYTYFRPLEQDLPEDDILPFLDFGRKLSPSLPTPPSSINSIENKSSATRSKSKDLHSTNVNINSTPVDEDVIPEDMDVTYVKKAVERNFAPRVPIQTHAPGISNYYRRRHPPATSRATADNLVVTSTDCSSPSTGHNNNTKSSNQSIRNTNRQHNSRQTETGNGDESKCDTPGTEIPPKEILNSSANLSDKNVAESFNAAESSLVNSVNQIETLNNTNTVIVTNSSNNTSGRSSGYNQVGNLTTAPNRRTESNVTTQEDSAKTASTTSPDPQLTTRILSTAVVTSVSLKESSFNNSENPVTAPPSLQPPLPTRLARVVNSTIDRTNDTYRIDNSAANYGNHTHQSDISGKQPITDFNSKVIPVQSNRSNQTPSAESTSNVNSRERVSPLAASHTPSRSTADNKRGTQLTSNFTSSESEIRTKLSETNHPTVTDNSDKQLLPRNITSSESMIRTEPSEANHPTITDISGKQLIRNLTSLESEVRTESFQTNRTFIAEKSDRQLTSYLSSSEGVIPVQPSSQVNHTSRSEKNGKQLVTANLTTESVVPIESSQPTDRLNNTYKIENNRNLTSERLSPTESSQTIDNTNHTVTVEKTDTNMTDNLTPVVGLIPAHTSLTTNRSGNDGDVANTEGSVDPLSVLETTTTSLFLTPLTNDSSLRTTNDTKESPTSEDLPKSGPAIHEEHVLGNSSGDGTDRSSEVTVNATTDGSVYVDNNTIADLPPTDVYYDYEETNMEPDDSNDTTVVIHGETREEQAEEVDEWLQNSTIIGQNVEVAYPQPTIESSTYILVGLSIIPILLGAAVAARFFLLRNKKKVLDESEYSSEYNRSPLSMSNASPLPTKLPRVPQHLGWEMEKSPPSLSPSLPSSKWEFPREKLRLQTVLGQGNFGQVWKAEADDISGHEGLTRLVAVKSVKESASAREREDLLRELGIMQDLGSHPNVVTLLGCCTEKEPYYLIMEYVMYGKLLTFLRDHRTRAHYYNFSDVTDALTSRDLTVFMYCVARGMDYLSNKGIIHRDLAARNVLVDHNKLCKIADFGMSRNVRDTGQIYEQRQSKGALPIRWMAPESLHYSLFTHKSDVWSFGILLWEIITLGSTPYATMGAREVMRRVRDGYRLERPSHCRPELFRVISRCWHADPNKRPTFAEHKHEIGQLLTDTERGSNYIDLDSLHEEMKQSSQRSTLQRNQ